MISHRALSQYDIIREIFYFLSRPGDLDGPKKSRRDFLALTLVCKNLSAIALDYIWAALDGLHPILALMPRSFPVLLTPTLWNGLWRDNVHFAAEYPCPQELERVQFYCRRVKFVTIDTGYTDGSYKWIPCTGQLEAWAVLARISSSASLEHVFPRLRELTWYQQNQKLLLQEIRLFISPVLEMLSIKLSCEMSYPDLPEALKRATPPLSRLTINLRSSRSGNIHRKSCVNFLASGIFERLRYLDIGELSPPTFQTLTGAAHLPSLEELVVDLCLPFFLKPSDLPKDAFPSLRSVTLSGTMVNVISFLAAVSSSNLHSMRIQNPTWEIPEHSQQYVKHIGGLRRFSSSLRKFEFDDEVGRIPEDPEKCRAMFSDMIRILFVLPNLEELDLYFMISPVPLSDTDVVNIASSWPQLRKLGVTMASFSSLLLPFLST